MERLSYVRGGAAVAMKRVQGCKGARVRAQGRKCCDMRMYAIESMWAEAIRCKGVDGEPTVAARCGK